MSNLTVILPTKNSEKNIDILLKSLKEQDFQDFYLYVADGSSKDNTIEIIKKYDFNLSIISTTDISAEDGINKCLRKINTKYFCLLNSDDKLGQKNYLSALLSELKQGADIAFSNFGSLLNNVERIVEQKDDFSSLIYHNIAPDIGWIAKSSVLKEGLFPENYKLATAYLFLLRLYNKGYIFKRHKDVYYYFRIGGNSYKDGFLAYTEQKDISLKFGANKLLVYIILFRNLIKFFIKHRLLGFLNKI